MQRKLIVAIDGYSSCGKSTLARGVARARQLHYLDTGAMYRAVTLHFLRTGVPIPEFNLEASAEVYPYDTVLDHIHIHYAFNEESGFSEVYLNGENVELEIRTMPVNENVSQVSTLRPVRRRMVMLQREAGRDGGVIMDGRDIGTVVFPDADLKVFMKADPLVRARRRHEELRNKGMEVSEQEVLQNIMQRDYDDTHRLESPLRMAEDAIVLDNTHLNHQQQIDFVLNELEKRGL